MFLIFRPEAVKQQWLDYHWCVHACVHYNTSDNIANTQENILDMYWEMKGQKHLQKAREDTTGDFLDSVSHYQYNRLVLKMSFNQKKIVFYLFYLLSWQTICLLTTE